jgi:replicative DNA helicase
MKRDGGNALNLGDLTGMLGEGLSLNHLADIELLRQARMRRRVLAVGRSLVQQMVEVMAPPEEAAAKAMGDLSDLMEPIEASVQTLWNVANQVMIEAEAGKAPDTLPSGLEALDAALGDGLRRRTLTVIAGRPSMGKSALATQIGLHAATSGRRVLLFSLEMSAKALVTRMIATEAGLEPVLLRRAKLNLTDWPRIRRDLMKWSEAEFYVDDDAALTSARAAAVVREVKTRHGLDLIIVDYLQRMADVMRSNENRNQLLGQITRAFAILGRQLDCAVILVSQLNRKPESAANRRPSLSDLRDSGEIEADADNVLLLYRRSYYDREADQHEAELIVAKQREGPTLSVPLYWEAERVRFRSVDVRHSP